MSQEQLKSGNMSTQVNLFQYKSWIKTASAHRSNMQDFSSTRQYSAFNEIANLSQKMCNEKRRLSVEKNEYMKKPTVFIVVSEAKEAEEFKTDCARSQSKPKVVMKEKAKTIVSASNTEFTFRRPTIVRSVRGIIPKPITASDCIKSSEYILKCDKLTTQLALTYITYPVIPREVKKTNKRKVSRCIKKIFCVNRKGDEAEENDSEEEEDKNLPEIILSETMSKWKENFMVSYRAEWEMFKFWGEVVTIF